MRRILILFGCLLAACQPTPTPFPVDIPTPATATPENSAPQPIHYAFTANTAGALANSEAYYPQAEITQLTEPVDLADLGSKYDIIITLGAYPDAVPSPTLLNYLLLINPALPPLNDTGLISIVTRSLNPEAMIQPLAIPDIRVTPRAAENVPVLLTEMANAGWPDGFELRLAHENALGFDALYNHFATLNISLISVPFNTDLSQTNLLLVTWSSLHERNQWAELVDDSQFAIELFGIPISYWAVPELNVTFSSQGWPVASRQ